MRHPLNPRNPPPPVPILHPLGKTTVDSAPSTAPASEFSESSVSDLEMPLSEPATAPVDDLLEQNPDAKETRKSGKTSAFARRLAELSLDAGQLDRFYSLSDYSQNQILNLDADHILRLLSLEEFVPQKASALFQYSPELLALLLKTGFHLLALVIGSGNQ